jgi:hypothetical protein
MTNHFIASVIPAQAGIQLIINTSVMEQHRVCPLRGMIILAGFRPAPE